MKPVRKESGVVQQLRRSEAEENINELASPVTRDGFTVSGAFHRMPYAEMLLASLRARMHILL